ncbi:hypothetical protein BSKO_04475 [Bryopsis sp. KO-2023]|nr:hypothetical protein BSKO_04475 [Bryopsis sp. KO-2023]
MGGRKRLRKLGDSVEDSSTGPSGKKKDLSAGHAEVRPRRIRTRSKQIKALDALKRAREKREWGPNVVERETIYEDCQTEPMFSSPSRSPAWGVDSKSEVLDFLDDEAKEEIGFKNEEEPERESSPCGRNAGGIEPLKRKKARMIADTISEANDRLKEVLADDDSAPGPGHPQERDKLEESSNAAISPIQVDSSLTFDDIGGLESIKRKLTEMVFLPLAHPELTRDIEWTPPRGAIFSGPPGTGKTLMARALAAMASRDGRKVSFFLRQGGDILSKWVGEAEKELRLLFEEAKKQQPSIIFFDEIDGLAPARNAKNDHSYNSIVSTFLALMDGLSDRGQVVVIGATNNVDSLDTALRRPGRFDREFKFPLPDADGRLKILNIHVEKLRNPPSLALRNELAKKCVGYAGADLKALCTEAYLNALRRCLPQIYETGEKEALDASMVTVERCDFIQAFEAIRPSAHRSSFHPAQALTVEQDLLLSRKLEKAWSMVCDAFPPAKKKGGNGKVAQGSSVMLCGSSNNGVKLLARAMLDRMDDIPVYSVGLQDLCGEGGSLEEAFTKRCHRARQSAPSVLYLPDIEVFWENGDPLLRAFLKSFVEDMLSTPVLLLATSGVQRAGLDNGMLEALGMSRNKNVYGVKAPGKPRRRELFAAIVDRPPPVKTPQNQQSLQKNLAPEGTVLKDKGIQGTSPRQKEESAPPESKKRKRSRANGGGSKNSEAKRRSESQETKRIVHESKKQRKVEYMVKKRKRLIETMVTETEGYSLKEILGIVAKHPDAGKIEEYCDKKSQAKPNNRTP